MKEFILLMAFFSLFLSLGCVDLSPPFEEVPSDFKVVYEPWGAMSFSEYELIINSNGNSELIHSAGLLKNKQEFTLTNRQVLEIANSVKSNLFFSMQDSYYDPYVMDGGGDRLTVTMDGLTKKVSVTNYNYPPFTAIKKKIREFTFDLYADNYYSIDDLLVQCPSVLLLCPDSNKDYLCNHTRSICDYASSET